MTIESAKKAASVRALDFVKDGMIIGLGTGSTAHYFIEELAKKFHQGLKIHVVATSSKSYELAMKKQLPFFDINRLTSIDLTVDGADEIDSEKRMIKGGGGALVREKIVASMSRELIIVVDETKCVQKLGKRSLPIEIIPFGHFGIKRKIENLGYHGNWRSNEDGTLFVTDNHNLILDIHFDQLREHPEQDHERIMQIPGVVNTGFFFHLAGRVIVGYLNGSVKVWS